MMHPVELINSGILRRRSRGPRGRPAPLPPRDDNVRAQQLLEQLERNEISPEFYHEEIRRIAQAQKPL